MSSAHVQRGLLLFQQARYAQAEEEFGQALAADPNDALSHALLGLCLAQRREFHRATAQAETAIHLQPDQPFGHYARASILHDRNRLKEALAAVEEAIRLDPEDPQFLALKSNIHLDQRDWARALEAAEAALRLDPEHVTSNNLRAIALVKLGRKQEAGATIDAALAKDPENAVTHANRGWTCLEHSEPRRAMEHFREALRLEPENEWARQGIVEALKARYFIYAIMLRYFLWMAKLDVRARWGIVIGGYFLYRLLLGLGRAHPDYWPVIFPLIILYIAFALMTWLAAPLFNLILRLNRFGRYALSREQIVASNWIGLTLLACLLFLLAAFLAKSGLALIGALLFGLLLIPIAGTFNCTAGWPRNMMALYTVAVAAAGILSLALGAFGPENAAPLGRTLLGVSLLGAFLSGWVANALSVAKPKY